MNGACRVDVWMCMLCRVFVGVCLGRSCRCWAGLGGSDPIQCGTAASKAVLPVPSPQLTLRRAAAGHAPLLAPAERRLLVLDMLCLSCLV